MQISLPALLGHPLRQFVRRAAELLLQVGKEDVVTTILGRGHYERATARSAATGTATDRHTLKAEVGPLHLRPPTRHRRVKTQGFPHSPSRAES